MPSLNLGKTSDLLARVQTAYKGKPWSVDGKPSSSGPYGINWSDFAETERLCESDISKWRSGQKEAGMFLMEVLEHYLVLRFGDPALAVEVLYGDRLKALGFSPVPTRRPVEESRGLLRGLLERMAAFQARAIVALEDGQPLDALAPQSRAIELAAGEFAAAIPNPQVSMFPRVA
jgi:hypothetical protein